MKSHSWQRIEDDLDHLVSGVDGVLRWYAEYRPCPPKLRGLPTSAMAPEPAEDEEVFWVRCSGCGAEITTSSGQFPDKCHVGWRMPADCDETVVERIMEV